VDNRGDVDNEDLRLVRLVTRGCCGPNVIPTVAVRATQGRGSVMVVASLPCTPVPSELDVPPGRWHRRMWVSDEPVEFETYWRCVDGFPVSGLWPVLVPVDLRYPESGPNWCGARRVAIATCTASSSGTPCR
jgi:hypothetical protein